MNYLKRINYKKILLNVGAGLVFVFTILLLLEYVSQFFKIVFILAIIYLLYLLGEMVVDGIKAFLKNDKRGEE